MYLKNEEFYVTPLRYAAWHSLCSLTFSHPLTQGKSGINRAGEEVMTGLGNRR
jgi:hypothetical protein